MRKLLQECLHHLEQHNAEYHHRTPDVFLDRICTAIAGWSRSSPVRLLNRFEEIVSSSRHHTIDHDEYVHLKQEMTNRMLGNNQDRVTMYAQKLILLVRKFRDQCPGLQDYALELEMLTPEQTREMMRRHPDDMKLPDLIDVIADVAEERGENSTSCSMRAHAMALRAFEREREVEEDNENRHVLEHPWD